MHRSTHGLRSRKKSSFIPLDTTVFASRSSTSRCLTGKDHPLTRGFLPSYTYTHTPAIYCMQAAHILMLFWLFVSHNVYHAKAASSAGNTVLALQHVRTPPMPVFPTQNVFPRTRGLYRIVDEVPSTSQPIAKRLNPLWLPPSFLPCLGGVGGGDEASESSISPGSARPYLANTLTTPSPPPLTTHLPS